MIRARKLFPNIKRRRFAVLALVGLVAFVVVMALFLVYQRSRGSQAVRVRSYSLSQADPPVPPGVEIRAIDLSRQGSLLAIGLSNGETLLWRVTNELPQTIGSLKTAVNTEDRIGAMRVAIAASAPIVAIGVNVLDLDARKSGKKGRIRLWNFETQKSRDVWNSKEGLGEFAISAKGHRVAAWDVPHHPLQVIDCSTGKMLWSDSTVDFRFGPLSFSPDARYLAAGVDREIRIYESETGKLLRRCTGEMGSTISIAFSDDSLRVVTGGAYPALRVWGVHDASDDVEIPINFPERRVQSIESVAFTPDSQTVLAFIPKFEKSDWWDRLWRERSVDSFDHVGTLLVRHSLSKNVTTSLLDSDLLFTKGCFCPDAGEVATWSNLVRTVDIWQY